MYQTAKARKKDSAYFRALAVKGSIQTAQDALSAGLVDGAFYDDQVKSLWYKWLRLPEKEKINFVSLGTYKQAVDYKTGSGKRIALVFADGDIVSGEGMKGEIGSDAYKNILRKIRFDEDIKAVVFRVNSPGGSALASDVIWREISLLKKKKPVVV
ncbi:MAG: signal peptide peptidase SppA, partial [Sphingobacteriia bacterium]